MDSALLLSSTALARLDPATRSAVFEAAFQLEERDEFASGPGEARLTPLPKNQVANFMSNVSELSKTLLEEIANGRGEWKHLMQIAEYDKWQQLGGFLSGLTRRMRNVTGNRDANFWGISKGPVVEDDVNGTWTNDTLIVHPTTLEGLRHYFGVA